MRFIYVNKNDPRVFVYRDENGPSGYGVTLNFAHRKARVLGVLWIALLILPVVIFNVCERSSAIVILSILLTLGSCIGIGVACYRGASRDLKRFPGLKGPRDGKGNLWL